METKNYYSKSSNVLKKAATAFNILAAVIMLMAFAGFNKASAQQTINLTSGLDTQAVCNNSLIIVINYNVGGTATGAGITGLPTGVSGLYSAGTYTVSGAPSVSGTFYYTITTTGTGSPAVAYGKIIVNPIPALSSSLSPSAICSGVTFHYSPASGTSGATFAWVRPVVSGISNSAASGSGDPSEVLNNATVNPVNVTYVYTVTANGCTNPSAYSVTFTVRPIPALSSSLAPPALCSGTVFSYVPTSLTSGTSFSWSRALISGITQPAASGAGNPNETLTNTSSNPINVTYVFTLNANGCSGGQNVIVTVNPTPALNSSLTASTCSGSLFSYTPGSATSGASFAWTRASVSGISNGSSSGAGDPAETLINTTASPVNTTYIYTVSANGCSNISNFIVAATVYPTPGLSSSLAPSAICSGTAFNYVPASLTSGATFAWTRPAVSNISNTAGSGSGNPNEVLVNTSAAPVNVTYVYAVTANGCTNPSAYSVTLTVRPIPALSSTLTPSALCSGSVFSYVPASLTSGTTFSWSRALISGITEPAAAGAGNANETLINTSSNPINVTYAFSLNASGCSDTQNVLVTVNPMPFLNSSLTASTCSGSLFSYTPGSATSGASFAWTRASVSGISNSSSSGAGDPAETLINTTAAPVNTTYIYTVSANGCTNISSYNVVATVYPTPGLNSSLTPPAICSGTAFSYVPASLTSGAAFAWTRPAVANISNTAGSGSGDPNEVLVNTSAAPVNVTYVYTVTANGCTNPAAFSVVITVNPLPAAPIAAAPTNLTCTSLNANWSAVGSATAYFLDVSVDAAFSTFVSGYNNLNVGNVTTYNITGLTINTTYYYRVRAMNGCGTSLNSNTITFNAAAISSTATAASNIMCSSFDANWAAAAGASTYFLDVATDPAFSNFVTGYNNLNTGNMTTFNVTGLTVNVTYYYRVRAGNGCTTGSNSNSISSSTSGASLNSTLTPTAICSGSVFNYVPTSSTLGATFAWTRAVITGISNPAASGTGNPNETLTNTSQNVINVIYVYTVTANGCSVNQNVTVTVNPIPSLSSSLSPPAICSGTAFNYVPASGTSGAAFTWTRAMVVGISNPAASGMGNPNEILTNTTASPINVTYIYAVSANGCTNPTNFVLALTVNSLSTAPASAAASPNIVYAGLSSTLTETGGTLGGGGAVYSWFTGSCGGTLVGTGSSISVSPLVTTTYYVRAAGGCNTTSCASVTVTVSPAVWPGDADNDSIVNNDDLLPIGLFYSQTGTPRASVDNSWQAFAVANWGTAQANGHDIKHADCNGDGVIDASDTLAITLNFSLTHAIAPVQNNNSGIRTSDMYFVISGSSYTAGSIIDAQLWLGTSSSPISSLYGVSFNINFDASLIQTGTESISYPASWIGTPGTNAIKIAKIDELANTAYGAVTRIDHTDAGGFGKIADFKFQIKNSLTGPAVLHLSGCCVKADNAAGVTQMFTVQNDSISINQTLGIQEKNSASVIGIYPNPFSSQTSISFSKEIKNGTAKIIDVVGKEVKTINFSGNKLVIEKEELTAGIYFVQIVSEKGTIANKKIIVQ